MVRHPGCFTRHATPATGLDSIEALAEIFSLRRGSTAFFERRGMDLLELSDCVARRFREKREDLGDEDPRRGRDGDSGIDRHAFERPCEIRMARGP